MEQDFNRQASALFDVKREAFYKRIKENDINSFMYVFGVNLRSYHHQFKSFDLVAPYAQIFKPYWNIDIWSKVTWGADDVKIYEIYEEEFEKAMLTGVSQYDYMVSNAVKYNRPSWCLFGLIGMTQGCLNQNQFEVKREKDIFNEKDFIRCLSYLPVSFLKQYKGDLEYLFSYFDERGFKLMIDDLGSMSISE